MSMKYKVGKFNPLNRTTTLEGEKKFPISKLQNGRTLPVLDTTYIPKAEQDNTRLPDSIGIKTRVDSTIQNKIQPVTTESILIGKKPIEVPNNTYNVKKGDTLSGISRQHDTDLDTLKRLNPQIKDINKIWEGQTLVIGKKNVPITPIDDYRTKNPFELDKLNSTLDNLGKIYLTETTSPSSEYYVIEDKINHIASVFKNGKIVEKINTATGRNPGDALTVTKTNTKGHLVEGAGNMSTPAGMFRIISNSSYHGSPSFTRGKIMPSSTPIRDHNNKIVYNWDKTPKYDYEIPSSIHTGYVPTDKAQCNISNGCTRVSPEGAKKLSKYLKKNTRWYILPENNESGNFKVTGTGLSFISNDIQKLSSEHAQGMRDMTIQIPDHLNNNESVKSAAKTLENSKRIMVDKLNMPSDLYDKLSLLTLGIMGRESGYNNPGLRGTYGMIRDEIAGRILDKNVSAGPFQIRASSIPKELLKKLTGKTEVGYNELVNSSSSSTYALLSLYDIYKNIAPRYKEKYPDLSLEEITLAYYTNPKGVIDSDESQLRNVYAKTVLENANSFKLNYNLDDKTLTKKQLGGIIVKAQGGKKVEFKKPIIEDQSRRTPSRSEYDQQLHSFLQTGDPTYNTPVKGGTLPVAEIIATPDTPVYRGTNKELREDLLNTSPLKHKQVPRKYDKYKLADRFSYDAPAVDPSTQGLKDLAHTVAEIPQWIAPIPFAQTIGKGFKALGKTKGIQNLGGFLMDKQRAAGPLGNYLKANTYIHPQTGRPVFSNLETLEDFMNQFSDVHLSDEIMEKALVKKFGPSHTIQHLTKLVDNQAISELDASNKLYQALKRESNNFDGWMTKDWYNKTPKNLSGFMKKEVQESVKPIDKIKLKFLGPKFFSKTVSTPAGELKTIAPIETVMKEIGKIKRNPNLNELELYVQKFNDNLPLLNEIIHRNNNTIPRVNYSVTKLDQNGRLFFDSGIGNTDWSVRIKPGLMKKNQTVKNIINEEYYKNLPGLEITSSSSSAFGDQIPRRGSHAYKSLNEFLTQLEMGRVKPGFNSQSSFSRGLWENAIKKGEAIGHWNSPRTIYGVMKGVAPAASTGWGLRKTLENK